MAAHSSIPAWEIPWTEEPGRLQSMGPQESDVTKPPPPHSAPRLKIVKITKPPYAGVGSGKCSITVVPEWRSRGQRREQARTPGANDSQRMTGVSHARFFSALVTLGKGTELFCLSPSLIIFFPTFYDSLYIQNNEVTWGVDNISNSYIWCKLSPALQTFFF